MSDEIVPSETPAEECWAPKQVMSPGATDETITSGIGSNRAERFASFGALLSAFIASSWCWLPPLLILGGVSGAGMMTVLEEYRPIFLVVTIGLLGAAFYLTYWPLAQTRGNARSGWMTFNKIILWAVTGLVAVMLFFPQVLTLSNSGNRFTTDMQRTIFQIEGMTWPTWAPKAEMAIETAPGVLAVKVDYETGLATVGTQADAAVSKDEILEALKSLGYRAKVISQPPP